MMKLLKERKLDEVILAKCSPETRQVFSNPYSASWHPGKIIDELGGVLLAELGPLKLQKLHFEAAKNQAPFFWPLVKIILAVTGGSFSAIHERMLTVIDQTLRNVKGAWTTTSGTTGTMTLMYPCPVHPANEHAWRGSLEFVYSVANNGQCVVERASLGNPPEHLHLFIRW
jgi:hypothetical protein